MVTNLPTISIRGACPHDCPDTCSWVVEVDRESGRAVKLSGDKSVPMTDGFLCQKVAGYIERTYHEGRLKYPMRRTGPKGSGQFERISWDEAIRIITLRFRELSQLDPQSILPYSYAGTMGKLQYGSLDRRFFHLLGASLLDRTICATAGGIGCDITLGTRAVADPMSVAESKFIVNWGSNTKVTNSHLWAIIHRAKKAGAKIVTIDPHRSRTAASSDWWIPIRPGTDAALALGVMHILFRDNLQDQDYLDRYVVGVKELRDRVMNDYTPDRVAKITSLDVETIERFAHEYATTRPAMLRINYGMQRHGGGAMAIRTVCCLPAITGSWRDYGGGAMLSTSKMYPFDDAFLTRPDLIKPGTRTINMTQLAEALAGELPGSPVKALYVYNSNPASVCPNQNKVIRGLEREDLFTVVHDQFLTDTARYADIVLPATTQLEHFDIHNSYGHLNVQINNAAIAPVGESKPNTDVFRLLARGMGFDTSLFETPDVELARQAFERTTARVGINAHAFDNITFDQLVSDGPQRLNLPERWIPFEKGGFPTPSGKCEFYSALEAKAGRDPLPHYIPPHEDPQTKPELAARYPLQLLTPPTPSFLNSSFANLDEARKTAIEPRVEIHPIDASSRGIVSHQMVTIFNDRGRYKARAIVGETVRPGVVVSMGCWWNKDTNDGVNINSITSTALTDQGGGATFFDNLVQVESAI